MPEATPGLPVGARGFVSALASVFMDFSGPAVDRVTVLVLAGARLAVPVLEAADLAKPESSALGSRPS